MGEFNQQKYINEYMKEKYDRCIFNVPKGKKAIIEEYYKQKGYKSLNAYVNALIDADMKEAEEKSNVSIRTINNENGGTINIG